MAAEAVDRALAIYPEYWACMTMKAQLAAAKGDWAEALRLLETAKPHIPFPQLLLDLEAEARVRLTP